MLTEIPTLVTRGAPLPQTYNRETNTVDVVWTTGAQVRRFDWMEGPFHEELVVSPEACRLERLNAGAPVLDTHEADGLENVIGVVERAWIEGDQGMATLRFSSREDVQPYVQDIAAGIIRNVSVGYQVHNYEVSQPTDGSMPTWRATDWEPMEISIVPIPADMASQVRSRDTLHPVSITTQRSEAMSEPSEIENPAEEEVQTPAPEAPAVESAEEIARKAIAVERKRISGIRETVRMAKLDESVAEKLVDSGKPLDECRAEVLRMWSERVDASATQSGRGEAEQPKQSRAAEIAHDLLKQVAGVK